MRRSGLSSRQRLDLNEVRANGRCRPQASREVLERVERERGNSHLWPKLLTTRDPDMLELLHDATTHVLERRHGAPRKYNETCCCV